MVAELSPLSSMSQTVMLCELRQGLIHDVHLTQFSQYSFQGIKVTYFLGTNTWIPTWERRMGGLATQVQEEQR